VRLDGAHTRIVSPLIPTKPERITIRGPAGELEVVLEEPAHGQGTCFGVVCHPHPLHGGTLDNKVVQTVARVMHELGIPTLRFNFRGVGASEGGFDNGAGETDDALAVIDWGRERWSGASWWLAGFSFGAFVALRASEQHPPERLITIAPPVQRFQFGALRRPECPWLLVQGDQDDVVECKTVQAWARSLSPPPDVAILRGAGHFFHGRLPELRETILEHVKAQPGSQADSERISRPGGRGGPEG
jgi:hypothetical protein